VLAFSRGCGGSSSTEPSASDDPATDFIAPEEACSVDADCVITDFPGCCECCTCSVPYAIRGDALAQERARCAMMDCAPIEEEQECAIVECERCPLERRSFEAACRRGRCVRIE
jgi:hypothetical protein